MFVVAGFVTCWVGCVYLLAREVFVGWCFYSGFGGLIAWFGCVV